MATFAVPTAVFSPEAQTASLQVQRLIERAKKGEQQAFVSLFQAHSRRIYTGVNPFAETIWDWHTCRCWFGEPSIETTHE